MFLKLLIVVCTLDRNCNTTFELYSEEELENDYLYTEKYAIIINEYQSI